MDGRSTHASAVSVNQGNFRARVIARDRSCVMTGDTKHLTVCHVIPHAKTDQVCSEHHLYHSELLSWFKYMVNLIKHRHEQISPPLCSINDTRNGILLSEALYGPFGASEIAFLKVSYQLSHLIAFGVAQLIDRHQILQ